MMLERAQGYGSPGPDFTAVLLTTTIDHHYRQPAQAETTFNPDKILSLRGRAGCVARDEPDIASEAARASRYVYSIWGSSLNLESKLLIICPPTLTISALFSTDDVIL